MKKVYVSWLVIIGAAAGCAGPREVEFRRHVINADVKFESASVFDVNRDGRLDIFNGGFWYEGPRWKQHFVREIQYEHGYYYNFSDLPVDVDGDGWIDTISSAWHNKRLSWIRNPGTAGGTWEEIVIDEPGNLETAILGDVNRDGQPDVITCVFNGRPAWYEFQHDPNAPHGIIWHKHPLPPEMEGAGLGTGDINGDGRVDIVGGKGWAEQTDDQANPWLWHAEFDLVDASIPVLVHDVDGDGDMDLIYGLGHNYGLYWLEQGHNAVGQRIWSRHEIDRSWSQAHVVLLGDLDGDGRLELVTGKRYYAHEGRDPGANDPRCIYYYRFDPKRRFWSRHAIQEDGPAGLGISTELVDIDGDGDLDLAAPGKSGLYLFENLTKSRR